MSSDQWLIRVQVAEQEHECKYCPAKIVEGARYVRLALPPSPAAMPDIEVPMDEVWKYVGRDWDIEKFHVHCYRLIKEGRRVEVHAAVPVSHDGA